MVDHYAHELTFGLRIVIEVVRVGAGHTNKFVHMTAALAVKQGSVFVDVVNQTLDPRRHQPQTKRMGFHLLVTARQKVLVDGIPIARV